MEKFKKDYSISLLRMLCVISIFFCHSFEYSSSIFGNKEWILKSIGNYLANGVQIFFLISGFLYADNIKKENFSTPMKRIEFLIKNSLKILKNYWIYCILFIFPIYYFKEPTVLTKRKIIEVLFTSDVIYGVHHLWFISYILFCYFLTPYLFDIREYLKKQSKRKYIIKFFFIILFINAFCYFFKFYFFPEWICCYIIGFFIADIKNLLDNKEKKIISVFIFVNFIILNLLRYYTNYIVLDLLPITFVNKITYWSQVFFAIVIFHIVYGTEIKSAKLKSILKFSDKYSYDIYLAHMIYVKGALSTIFLTKFLPLNYIITFLLSISSGIILYHICRKIENLFYGGKK